MGSIPRSPSGPAGQAGRGGGDGRCALPRAGRGAPGDHGAGSATGGGPYRSARRGSALLGARPCSAPGSAPLRPRLREERGQPACSAAALQSRSGMPLAGGAPAGTGLRRLDPRSAGLRRSPA
ncbi:collagen alpha-1(I) chain-like [Gallus gallus]|uniref:collagen alpha-1(I) chain-like n=1 Tax=Gallus gallus TaxID=9031 RepID=UPI001F01E66D|nr:collagen alpha-1(I) chain-like [Gallus gallus]XP_046785665.1 collagen alpha-1(I) chain-like [Gallus gallus]